MSAVIESDSPGSVADPTDASEAWPEFELRYDYGSDVYDALDEGDLVVYEPVAGMERGRWILAGDGAYVSVESVQ